MRTLSSFEVPLDSVECAAIAAPHVDRIEVCSELETEGWTPSFELLRPVVDVARGTGARIFALIRPRPETPGSGGDVLDFVLDDGAIGRSLDAIEEAASAGVDGIAIGPLLVDGRVDRSASEALVGRASEHGLETSFLRSFDLVPDRYEALAVLTTLGIVRVLTTGSGCWHHATTSMADRARNLGRDVEACQQLALAAGRAPVEIMACGGLRAGNVADFLPVTGHVHASCRIEGVFDATELRSLELQVRSVSD